jgi:surface protein
MNNDDSILKSGDKRKRSDSMVDDNDSIHTTTLRHQQTEQQWCYLLDDALVRYVLSFLNFTTLLQLVTVSKRWRKHCQETIRNKYCSCSKAFQCKKELRRAVTKYCTFKAATMEEIAGSYGYPIDSWDVSQITDMSSLFEDMNSFNEHIGSWNVSNVTNMSRMFYNATVFNRKIGSWDTSNVSKMRYMFDAATSFNQEIGSWNVSNVTDMGYMFVEQRPSTKKLEVGILQMLQK